MEWRQQRLYLGVLAEQLEFAAFAYDELADCLIDPDEMMRRAQAFLSHAALASRLLWPQPGKGERAKKRVERGRMLREMLGIPDSHELGIRDLRNTWEHFDERLDDRIDSFAFDQTSWQVIGGMMREEDSLRVVRHYDYEDRMLTIFGTTEDLKKLRAAVGDVGARVYAVLHKKFLDDGGPPENVGPFPHRRMLRSDS